MCQIQTINNYNFSDLPLPDVKVPACLFWVDGFFCIIFALLTHFKYTSVTVLNYRVCTVATSNLHWICFFIYTAVSSIMSGLYLWPYQEKAQLIITAWLANLFSILSLVFAVKYQWKHREQAYDNMAGGNVDETTPILLEQSGMTRISRPSKADLFFFALFLLSGGFFVAAWITETNPYYWIAHGFLWFLQVIVFIMIVIIYHNVTQQGPSIGTKCVLMGGVIMNALAYIPAYIWFECIFDDNHNKNHDKKFKDAASYDVLVGLILVSHIAFFFVVRTEFLRLKDVVIWRVTGQIERFEGSQTNVQRQ